MNGVRRGVSTVYRILTHPAYAGTYAYGRTPIEPKRRRRNGQPGIRHAPMAEWAVTLHDRLPAYITWEQYLRNTETPPPEPHDRHDPRHRTPGHRPAQRVGVLRPVRAAEGRALQQHAHGRVTSA